MATRLYGRRGNRKIRFRRQTAWGNSARRHARTIRSYGGSSGGVFKPGWQPKRGRRKLGARRKTTIFQTLTKWIPVKVYTRRRR